jgi:O-antigen/teichoic acid export membrane protein
MSVINAVAKLLTFPLIFILVKQDTDYLPAVLIHSTSYLLAGVIATVLILSQRAYRKIPLAHINRKSVVDQIKYSWPIFLSNSAVSLYTSSLTLILGLYGSAMQVGLFGAVERIVRVVCFGIYVPVSQSAFPVLSRLAATDFHSAKRLFKGVFYSVFLVMSIVCLIFILMDSYIIQHFLGEYSNVKLLLRISIFTILPIALGGVCGQLGLMALGNETHKRVFSKIYTITGIISLPISFISIRFYFVDGAVLSMMLTEVAIFVAMFAFVKKFRFL